jgi:hypothetical protein
MPETDRRETLWPGAEPTRVEEFSATGSYIRQIGSAGTGNGQFTGLRAIAVAPGGAIWALDEPSPQAAPIASRC